MMHTAGTPVVLTLVLGKMCGVDVDESALLGSLRHWYRFIGHGASIQVCLGNGIAGCAGD